METITQPIVAENPVEFHDHCETVDSRTCHLCGGKETDIAPGATRSLNKTMQCLFRVDQVMPVEGIDYSAFDINSVKVGFQEQFPISFVTSNIFDSMFRGKNLPEGDKHHNSENAPWDVCRPGLYITFTVTNRSDKAQPFAISVSGKAIY